MATKITAESDFKQVKADLKETTKLTKELGDAAAKASQQSQSGSADDGLGPLRELQEQAAALRERLNAIGSESGAAAASAAGGFSKLVPVLGAVVGGVVAIGGAVKGMQAVIATAAESGNEDAQKLVKAFDGIGTAWTDVANRIASTDAFRGVMGSLKDLTKEISTTVQGLGFLATGFSEASDKYMEQMEARKQLLEVSKLQGERDKIQRQEDLTASAEKIDSLEEINRLLDENIKRITERASKGNVDAKAMEIADEKQQALLRRRLQLLRDEEREKERAIREEEELKKKAAQEEERDQKALDDYRRKQLEQRVKDIQDALAAELKAEADALKQRLKMFAEYDAARKKQIAELAGRGEVQDATGQISAAASDPRAIARRLAENAAFTGGAAAGRKAYRQAINQSRGGYQAFTPEQIAEAQQQNAQSITQAMESTGNVGSEMVDALRQNLQAAQQLDQNNAQVAQEVAQIRAQLAEVGKNTTRRAQTMGRKQ